MKDHTESMATESQNRHDASYSDAANKVADEIAQINEDHGFREDWAIAEYLDHLANYLSREKRFTTDEIPVFDGIDTCTFLHNASNALRINVLGMKLMLTTSELAEALDTLRDEGMGIAEGLGNWGEELADAKIRIDDLAHMTGVMIGDEVTRKIKKNRDRPFKHGRKV